VTPELIFAVISSGVGAFAGLSKSLSEFNKKIERRFESVEKDLDLFQDRVLRNYVLKEDFLREIQSVHIKLDRILDHILANRP
jgi:flagellar capping protein FliD